MKNMFEGVAKAILDSKGDWWTKDKRIFSDGIVYIPHMGRNRLSAGLMNVMEDLDCIAETSAISRSREGCHPMRL